jgi:hypothetical protein
MFDDEPLKGLIDAIVRGRLTLVISDGCIVAKPSKGNGRVHGATSVVSALLGQVESSPLLLLPFPSFRVVARQAMER